MSDSRGLNGWKSQTGKIMSHGRPAGRLLKSVNMRRCSVGTRSLGVNGAYLATFAHASIFYEANVVLHLALGLALAFVAVRYAREYPK